MATSAEEEPIGEMEYRDLPDSPGPDRGKRGVMRREPLTRNTGEDSASHLARERDELLEQQTATAEILRVISSSPGDLQPVFEAILENATRICEAKFGNLWLREGDKFRIVAIYGGS
jgi:hypothetical protein